MPRILIKLRLHSSKHKYKINQQKNNIKPNLPPNLQTFKQNLSSGNGVIEHR